VHARGLVLCVAVLVLVPAFIVAEQRVANAEEDKLEFADGPTACRALHARNDVQLVDYEKLQPATPYKYPHQDTILGAPWGPLTDAAGDTVELILASVVPHFGAQYRADNPVVMISWPWSIPFGPTYTCSRHRGKFTVSDYKFHRAMIEPAVTAGSNGTGFFTRLGYRFLYHPSDWVVGAGGGFGTAIDLAFKGEPKRASISPEAVMQFGHCCDSSYFTFAIRYDHYFAGSSTDIVGGSLGYTFF
jgi:hypothetical protein